MHHPCATVIQQRQAQEIAHLLDPCYHIDTSAHANYKAASPCPSMLSTHSNTNSTWRDATGKHDPDFRPFVTTRPTFPHSTRRSSLEAPLSPAAQPSKAERAAARSELHPALREALLAHERELARERRPTWLKRHRKNSDPDAVDYVQPVDDDDRSPSSPSLYLPELVADYGSEEDLDEDAESDEKSVEQHPHREHLKQQLASLTLRVDLAVFRAKKRLRRRVGLE